MRKVKFINLDSLVYKTLGKIASENYTKEKKQSVFRNKNELPKTKFAVNDLKLKTRRIVFSSGQFTALRQKPKEIKIKFIVRQ